MQRWSKRINYMDEVKVEGLGTKLYLVCEFLVAISSYSFRITVLFLQYCHQAQLLLSKIYQLLHNNLIVPRWESSVPRDHDGSPVFLTLHDNLSNKWSTKIQSLQS